MKGEIPLKIETLGIRDKRELVALYRTVAADLNAKGLKQWDRFYPNGFVVGKDLREGHAFGIRQDGILVAAGAVDRHFNKRYAGLPWEDSAGDPACLHRLAVLPSRQGQGLGKLLLRFAESQAREMGATSVRLDVFGTNEGAVGMYERAGYAWRGSIRYPMRKVPFHCMEKLL